MNFLAAINRSEKKIHTLKTFCQKFSKKVLCSISNPDHFKGSRIKDKMKEKQFINCSSIIIIWITITCQLHNLWFILFFHTMNVIPLCFIASFPCHSVEKREICSHLKMISWKHRLWCKLFIGEYSTRWFLRSNDEG